MPVYHDFRTDIRRRKLSLHQVSFVQFTPPLELDTGSGKYSECHSEKLSQIHVKPCDSAGCSAPQDNFTTTGSVNVVSNDVEGCFDVFSLYGIHENEYFYLDSIISFGSGDLDFQRAQTVNGLRDEDGFILLERVRW